MPPELTTTIIAVAALLAGLVLVLVAYVGRGARNDQSGRGPMERPRSLDPPGGQPERDARSAESTLRVVWWLTITIVLLGVGLSGSFAADQAPIFLLGGLAVVTVVIFHELLASAERGRLLRLAEALAAVGLIGGLLVLTGYASSPFAILFALVSVAAALAFGPRAGVTAAGLATATFAVVLLLDPNLPTYAPQDALSLSTGLGATWLLAFIAIAYSGHQRRAVSHALELSRTDPLTGLFNRSQLSVTLDQEVSRTRRSDRGFCVLMIDLDGLKAINDTSGHLRGDEVLRALGTVIRASIRTVDSAYRFGGDEFVVLLPETDIVGAFVVAEKVRSGAEEVSYAMDGDEPVASVSIGLVSHPEDGLSAEELMAAADRAMYQAKRMGKNQISGNPRPRPALIARRSASSPAPTVVEPELEPEPEPEQTPEADAEPPSPSTAPREPGPPATAPLATAPRADRAIAVPLGPVVTDQPSPPRSEEVDDADPQEVRRQIASASRSFDPDHQIRRAMDAFLSPAPSDPDRPPPDH